MKRIQTHFYFMAELSSMVKFSHFPCVHSALLRNVFVLFVYKHFSLAENEWEKKEYFCSHLLLWLWFSLISLFFFSFVEFIAGLFDTTHNNIYDCGAKHRFEINLSLCDSNCGCCCCLLCRIWFGVLGVVVNNIERIETHFFFFFFFFHYQCVCV